MKRCATPLRAGKTPLIQAPTGFGKTLTAAHIIQRALDKGNRVVFTVPALSLIEQTVDAFRKEGISSVGVLQGDHILTDPTQPVQVCSVQTLARRKKPEAALVIIDEVHQMFKSVCAWITDPHGRTCRSSVCQRRPGRAGWASITTTSSWRRARRELIDAGYLSKFVAFAPSEPDLSDVHTVAGEYHQGELGRRHAIPRRLSATSSPHGSARGEDRPTLATASTAPMPSIFNSVSSKLASPPNT